MSVAAFPAQRYPGISPCNSMVPHLSYSVYTGVTEGKAKTWIPTGAIRRWTSSGGAPPDEVLYINTSKETAMVMDIKR